MHLTVIVKLLVFSKRVGTSVPSYVLRVPSCPTCLTCFTCLTCLGGLHAHVLYVFACLHAFLRAFFFLLAVCAFIILSAFTLYVPSFFYVLCVPSFCYMPYVPAILHVHYVPSSFWVPCMTSCFTYFTCFHFLAKHFQFLPCPICLHLFL